jgi:hypothetical protein
MKAYHFLQANMTAGSGNEPAWTVGEEREVKGKLQMYAHGYHSSRTWRDALNYAPGFMSCIVEIPARGTLKDTSKQVSRKRKLIAVRDGKRTLLLWVAECAERALLREREAGREPDKRSWKAIDVIRLFADGKATLRQMDAAANAAYNAASAAYSAADSAASAAYNAASAAYSAAYNAASAADSAADSAASAAYNAASAEKDWQANRLDEMMTALFEEAV